MVLLATFVLLSASAQAPVQVNDGVSTRVHPDGNTTAVELETGTLVVDNRFPDGWSVWTAQSPRAEMATRALVLPQAAERGLEFGGALFQHANARLTGAEVRAPFALEFADRLDLRLGGPDLQLHWLGEARTTGDAWVWLPESRTLITGWTVSEGDPRVHASTDFHGWRRALGRARALDPEVVVPASGAPGGPELLDRMLERVVAAETVAARSRLGAEIGTSRNGRVAIAGGASAERPLVYLSGPRSAEELELLKEAAPGVEVVVARSQDEARELAARAHGVDGRFANASVLAAAPELRWVQAGSAGVERYLSVDPIREREEVVLTNMKGMHGPSIADHSFAMLLSLSRGIHELRDHQEAQRWSRDLGGTWSLHGRTMLVVGLGGIGNEVARRARGFGMEVLATSRSKKPTPEYVDRLEQSPALDAMLPLADVVAICLPLTDETRGLFDAARIARMKPGAVIINVGRGAIIDTDAMVSALESGHLGGACLDVTDPEPLPAGHPLWDFDQVVISPHVSGRAEVTSDRRQALFVENLRRFGAGEPLLNVVDKELGY